MRALGPVETAGLAVQVVVIAKEPRPGAVKTRLCPPLRPEEAAQLATAALADTCRAVVRAPLAGRMIALEGRPGRWLPDGVEVLRQRPGTLGDRLAGALEDAWRLRPLPTLVVGMDTPQIDGPLLGAAARALVAPGVDAVLGPALDGGYWCIGLRRPVAGLFDTVPMSTVQTGAAQWARLGELGLRCASLPQLRDVDEIADAVAVAGTAPGTEFALAARLLGLSAGVGASAGDTSSGWSA